MCNNTFFRAIGASALALTLGVGVAACGRDGEPSVASAPSTTEHNDADVAFASEMLQHHAQALSMVDLTVERRLDPEVTEMAEQIRAAQGPEIETFTDWLTEWDEEIPETMRDHAHAGHGESSVGDSMEGMDASMPGMMSAEDMTALEDAPDEDFQTMWLEMMVEHHTGAVEMASDYAKRGRFEPALALATDIMAAQTAEIETMRELLGS